MTAPVPSDDLNNPNDTHSRGDALTNSARNQITSSYANIFSNISSSLMPSFRWCPTSEQQLATAESELLSVLSRPFKTYFVDIGAGWGQPSNKIRTLEMLTSVDAGIKKKLPLVLIHGFAAGIGTWILNLDTLSSTVGRKIYAIDILGFGRSSRPWFDLTGDVEGQFVESIERWRQEKGIDKFVLLGHSFGGYLSASYALRHPEHVSHVILADPWGVQDRQVSTRDTYRFPFWVRAVSSVFQAFNPLAVLRATGPYGPRLVQKLRGDLREKFRPKLQDDCHKFLNYIYHCNAQKATGETAFKSLTLPYGWPKNPLIHRLLDLHSSVDLTFIYGQRSWIESGPGEFLKGCLGPDRVTVNIIQGSGHHVYADNYMEFNDLIKDACARVRE